MNTLLDKILAPFYRIFSFIRALFIYNVRLDGLLAVNFYTLVLREGTLFTLAEEFVTEGLPRQYDAYGLLRGMGFSFTVEERLLRAGMSSIDYVVHVSFLRIYKRKFMEVLRTCGESNRAEIPVYLMSSWNATKIGRLSTVKVPDEPYMPIDTYNALNNSIKDVVENKKGKTGAILVGPPGNGKSYLVRHFAIKYELPVFIAVLDNDLSNTDVLTMFSKIEGPCIVLLEDFDTHFDRRRPLVKGIKFSFDTILNSLDGVFADYQGVVFFMTANDLGKIDYALKHRPSRFEHIIHMDNPDVKIRKRIFRGLVPSSFIFKTEGYSLDMLLHLKDRISAIKDEDKALDDMVEFEKYLEEHRTWEKEEMDRKDHEESDSQPSTGEQSSA